ncbi:hypothetical protein L9F63_019992 [Diploptera punctata]|uniref:BPTI/Kunitz inhibitor domain-containing protein n=1 Tax=Diploptera punctata TaxID=6984 RepID=A0AAD7ZT11_DIPPU|nr:hypothetical protein L9F63_019992 [Diploptera punctata]
MARLSLALAVSLLVISVSSTTNAAAIQADDSAWYYNATIHRCYYDDVAPSDGSEDYDSEEDCYTHSETPEELCNEEQIVGLCDAYIPSYYYNAETHKCEQFIYGGCGGNGDRFMTEEACLAFCGGI